MEEVTKAHGLPPDFDLVCEHALTLPNGIKMPTTSRYSVSTSTFSWCQDSCVSASSLRWVEDELILSELESPVTSFMEKVSFNPRTKVMLHKSDGGGGPQSFSETCQLRGFTGIQQHRSSR